MLRMLYIQDKGSFNISLNATCDGQGMRMAQNLERGKNEENEGLFKD